MSAFTVVVFEGAFQKEKGRLGVREGGSFRSVEDALAPLVGQNVKVALHYVPEGLDSGKPGFGSCLHPHRCPVHTQKPGVMFNFQGEGLLEKSGEVYHLRTFQGIVSLPLNSLLGHRGRVLASPVMDVGKMREVVESSGFDFNRVQQMGAEAERLREVLTRIQETMKEK